MHPSASYMQDDVKYFAPGADFKIMAEGEEAAAAGEQLLVAEADQEMMEGMAW